MNVVDLCFELLEVDGATAICVHQLEECVEHRPGVGLGISPSSAAACPPGAQNLPAVPGRPPGAVVAARHPSCRPERERRRESSP